MHWSWSFTQDTCWLCTHTHKAHYPLYFAGNRKTQTGPEIVLDFFVCTQNKHPPRFICLLFLLRSAIAERTSHCEKLSIKSVCPVEFVLQWGKVTACYRQRVPEAKIHPLHWHHMQPSRIYFEAHSEKPRSKHSSRRAVGGLGTFEGNRLDRKKKTKKKNTSS